MRRHPAAILWIVPSAMLLVAIGLFALVVPGRFGGFPSDQTWMIVGNIANFMMTPLLTAGLVGFVVAMVTSAVLWNRARDAEAAAATATGLAAASAATAAQAFANPSADPQLDPRP